MFFKRALFLVANLLLLLVANLRKVTHEITHPTGLFLRIVPKYLKGGPEPLEKESHEFLGSKRDDRFSLFLKWYQKHVKIRVSYMLWHDNFCKGPRTLRKFPQKCQKIAGC